MLFLSDDEIAEILTIHGAIGAVEIRGYWVGVTETGF